MHPLLLLLQVLQLPLSPAALICTTSLLSHLLLVCITCHIHLPLFAFVVVAAGTTVVCPPSFALCLLLLPLPQLL